ncbi:MAG: alpha/beta hydrolase [Spirochaetia bacterium]|nr:alpha/beta hydrolase [Spirochaetia bacterium]
MNILLEITKEIFSYLLAAGYTILGVFIRPENTTSGDKNPVILLSGIMGTPLVWSKLRRRLVKEGYPVYIPWLSFQTASAQSNAKKLEQFILENNLRDIYIIGHSAGGIIATQMGYKGRDRIKKLFAISTPFHGTLLALLVFFIPAGRQLICRSSFLRNNEVNFMTFPNLQCIFSRFDLLIFPGFQGKLGRNDDIEYPGLGHLNVIMNSAGINFIMDKLEIEDSKEKGKVVQKVQSNAKTVRTISSLETNNEMKSDKKILPGKNPAAQKASIKKTKAAAKVVSPVKTKNAKSKKKKV